jgi:hypothetical protein
MHANTRTRNWYVGIPNLTRATRAVCTASFQGRINFRPSRFMHLQ